MADLQYTLRLRNDAKIWSQCNLNFIEKKLGYYPDYEY